MDFSDIGTLDVSVSAEWGVVMGVVDGLTPGTMYEVTVAGVNGAMRGGGVGVESDSATANTESGMYNIVATL